eukprot:1273804-Rhodomonas_salina.2
MEVSPPYYLPTPKSNIRNRTATSGIVVLIFCTNYKRADFGPTLCAVELVHSSSLIFGTVYQRTPAYSPTCGTHLWYCGTHLWYCCTHLWYCFGVGADSGVLPGRRAPAPHLP